MNAVDARQLGDDICEQILAEKRDAALNRLDPAVERQCRELYNEKNGAQHTLLESLHIQSGWAAWMVDEKEEYIPASQQKKKEDERKKQ